MQLQSILALGCAVALQSGAAMAEKPYQLVREIPIGGEGGWDIQTVDAAARRLYLSHATKVVVIDLEKNAIAGEIADTPGVHALVAVPEFARGFSSNGKENKSSVVDLKTLKTIAKLDTGENPDAITYDAKRGEVHVFNPGGGAVGSAPQLRRKNSEYPTRHERHSVSKSSVDLRCWSIATCRSPFPVRAQRSLGSVRSD